MRLIVLLDNKIDKINLLENDIILVQNHNDYLTLKVTNKVILVDFTKGYESNELQQSVNMFFSGFNKDIQKLSNYTYLKLFCPIYSIIVQIREIIETNPISEMVLIGGSEHIFLSFTRAEGEGVKRLYKTHWLINPIIYQYFKDEIKIKWLKKKNKLLFFFANLVRENSLWIKTILLSFYKTLFIKSDYTQINKDDKETAIIVTNLPLQYRHLTSLLEKEEVDKIYITPSNWNQKITGGLELKRKPIKYNELLKNIYKSYKEKFMQTEMVFSIKGKNIKFNSYIVNKCIQKVYFTYLRDTAELSNTIKRINSNKKYLITDMTFGIDIITVHTVAEELNIKHLNYQYVNMFPMLFSNFNLADIYYLYSKNTFDMYKGYSDIFRYYLPVKRKPELFHKQNTEAVNIVIFTQPDRYTDRYLYLIEELSNKLRDLVNVNVKIKLHYRQDKMEEFSVITEKYSNFEIVDKESNLEKLIINADFIISMTSSVIFEALMLGTMSVIVNIENQDDKLIYNGGNLFPEVNFVVKSASEIVDIINNISLYKAKFLHRYNDFFN